MFINNNYINSYPENKIRSSGCRRNSNEARCTPTRSNDSGFGDSHEERMTYGLTGYPLASVYAPLQSFTDIYDCETGLMRGTIFSELDLPFVCGGMNGGVGRG